MTDISRDAFLETLHDALNHLYNTDQLRKSPLAEVFGVANRFDSSTALRKIISDAIESLKPPASEPDSSKAWRTYESLYCCFIQQLNQQVVADQLCISSRQLRREQHFALENLADVLWQKFQLGSLRGQLEKGEQSGELSGTQAGAQADQHGAPSLLISELGWLMDAQPVKPERLADEVQAAVAVVQPLALASNVTLRSLVAVDLPGLAIHSVALNQILVSLLSLAIHEAGGGIVQVAARKLPLAVETIIQLSPHSPAATTNPNTGGSNISGGSGRSSSSGAVPADAGLERSASLQIAAELTRISGGKLYTGAPGSLLPIRLILPALEQFPVLVVDDNEDSLQLLKRYAAGTRYNLACTRDTAQVAELVESIRPRIIVLDIMMPKENGWIVLGRLRQHPLTADTPVIICTILPQEKLALSLGASAYLKKPVSRQSFLQALDQQFALLEPEYR